MSEKKIDANTLNAFLLSAQRVIKQLTGEDMRKFNPTLKEAPSPSFDLSIILGITGAVKGQVCYSFTEDLGMKLLSKWFKNMLPAKLRKYYKSGLMELANMISGNAVSILAGSDKKIEISPPVVITGNDFQIEYIKLKTISVILWGKLGSLEINIALAEKLLK